MMNIRSHEFYFKFLKPTVQGRPPAIFLMMCPLLCQKQLFAKAEWQDMLASYNTGHTRRKYQGQKEIAAGAAFPAVQALPTLAAPWEQAGR